MKKSLAIFLAALMTVSLAGCSDGKAAEPAETTQAASTQSAAQMASTMPEEGPADMSEYGSVTLGDYKGLSVAIKNIEVTDEDVQRSIDTVLDGQATTEHVDRAAQNGDVVDIDYAGTKDGVAFEGGTAKGQKLQLGSDTFIDGFEEGLVGAKAGEKRTLNLTFPRDYFSAELAGQDVVFEVTVNEVLERHVPELTDDWVKANDEELKTAAEYTQKVRDTLEEYNKQSQLLQAQADLITQISNASAFDISQDAVTNEVETQLAAMKEMISGYGMDWDYYVQMTGETEETIKQQLNEYAEGIIKQKLITNEIMTKEGITVVDADYDSFALANGMSRQSLLNTYKHEDIVDAVKNFKVLTYIYENAVKTEQ